MTEAPWWGIPVIAGGFLIIGGLLTFLYTYLNDRRKARLEDDRRFEADIIEQYETLDRVIEQIHETMPPRRDDQADRERYMAIYWPLYMTTLRANQRLEIIAPRSIYAISGRIFREVNGFFPREEVDRSDMVALVEAGESLREELRKYLRIRNDRASLRERYRRWRMTSQINRDHNRMLKDARKN